MATNTIADTGRQTTTIKLGTCQGCGHPWTMPGGTIADHKPVNGLLGTGRCPGSLSLPMERDTAIADSVIGRLFVVDAAHRATARRVEAGTEKPAVVGWTREAGLAPVDADTLDPATRNRKTLEAIRAARRTATIAHSEAQRLTLLRRERKGRSYLAMKLPASGTLLRLRVPVGHISIPGENIMGAVYECGRIDPAGVISIGVHWSGGTSGHVFFPHQRFDIVEPE